ncbi:MAG: hypothetical protein OXK76_07735 [Gammaproteobacteria bacterium]|nr:hypothetical protein [Gammaproteobacteria bacterium]
MRFPLCDAGKLVTSRAQRRQDAIDAAAINEFAAKLDKAHRASNLDRGISPLMPRGW